jgi:hypothetical protein
MGDYTVKNEEIYCPDGFKMNPLDIAHDLTRMERLEKQLGVMTPLVRIKYGNLDSEVYEEILKSETLLQEKVNNGN